MHTLDAFHGRRALIWSWQPSSMACACRKLDPDVMMVQSAEDRQRKNATDRLDGSRQR
jgi:hypothetical protein